MVLFIVCVIYTQVKIRQKKNFDQVKYLHQLFFQPVVNDGMYRFDVGGDEDMLSFVFKFGNPDRNGRVEYWGTVGCVKGNFKLYTSSTQGWQIGQILDQIGTKWDKLGTF